MNSANGNKKKIEILLQEPKEYTYVTNLESLNPKWHLVRQKKGMGYYIAKEDANGEKIGKYKLKIVKRYSEYLMKDES